MQTEEMSKEVSDAVVSSNIQTVLFRFLDNHYHIYRHYLAILMQ